MSAYALSSLPRYPAIAALFGSNTGVAGIGTFHGLVDEKATLVLIGVVLVLVVLVLVVLVLVVPLVLVLVVPLVEVVLV